MKRIPPSTRPRLIRRWYALRGNAIEPIQTYAVYEIQGSTLRIGTNSYTEYGLGENGETVYLTEPESNAPGSLEDAETVVEYTLISEDSGLWKPF